MPDASSYSYFHLREANSAQSSRRRFLAHNSSSDRTSEAVSQSLFKNPIVHQLWNMRIEAKKRRQQQEAHEIDPDQGKPASASRVEISYPFSTDEILLESYRNPWGKMRLGKMMEDLDALAGNIAFFHVDTGKEIKNQPTLVTASVDRIRLERRPHMESDQFLSGEVTWTGRSSMEIRMQCVDSQSGQLWLEAFVTFVALDPQTKKTVRVPPVLPQSPEEEKKFAEGAARAELKKKLRKQKSGSSIEAFGNNSAETADELAKSLLVEAGPLLNMPSLADPHSILMASTKMQNAMIAQPQVQNLHKRIFGGFLMRRAFELAFSNAYVFGGARPIFLEVDDISFSSPVDVGDLLVFNSRVLYTERGRLSDYYKTSDHRTLPILHVEVEAWVTEPERASAVLSNSFYFTFACDRPFVRRVLPSNIDEAHRMATRILTDKAQSRT